MHRLIPLVPLLLLAGCPQGDSSQQAAQAPDPAEARKAQVDLETRVAEGDSRIETTISLEAKKADAKPVAKEPATPAPLPEVRYYAFDG